jgi:hypothetical protein
MKVALYVGDHAGDSLWTRMGAWLTRYAQKGDEFGRVTHCEAVLAEHGDGTADIASSSVRDGGVRIMRRVLLQPGNWLIVEVPTWSAERAREWFIAHAGQPYDWRGAWATVMPGHHRSGQWFCNEAVGAAVGLRTPQVFTPSQFAAICFSFSKEGANA